MLNLIAAKIFKLPTYQSPLKNLNWRLGIQTKIQLQFPINSIHLDVGQKIFKVDFLYLTSSEMYRIFLLECLTCKSNLKRTLLPITCIEIVKTNLPRSCGGPSNGRSISIKLRGFLSFPFPSLLARLRSLDWSPSSLPPLSSYNEKRGFIEKT